ATPERVIYLWNLAADTAMTSNLDALLHFTQALEAALPATKMRLDLVTRNAQPAGATLSPTSVEQAPSIGLIRVILNEYTNLSWRAIDLPPESSAADTELLWNELCRTDGDREIALRGEARYV